MKTTLGWIDFTIMNVREVFSNCIASIEEDNERTNFVVPVYVLYQKSVEKHPDTNTLKLHNDYGITTGDILINYEEVFIDEDNFELVAVVKPSSNIPLGTMFFCPCANIDIKTV